MLSEPSYGPFVSLSHGHGHNFQQNGQISWTEYRNKKIRALSFLQLLKFEKVRWPSFCILCFLSRDMAIFWFCPGDMLFHKMAISRKRGIETKKIRALSFFQLLKFEKVKWPYFSILWFLCQDMVIFWLCPRDMFFHKMAISRKRGSKTKK